MRERQGGVSSIHSFKSAYYMIKVTLALIIDRLVHPQGRKGAAHDRTLAAVYDSGRSWCCCCIIFALLKRGLMSVKYSLLWLLLAVGLVIAAAFPYVVYVLRDLLDIEMPVNLVFLLMFCFVLVVLLSLSIAITQLAEKCKRLTQANAILEKRVRDLEENNLIRRIKMTAKRREVRL